MRVSPSGSGEGVAAAGLGQDLQPARLAWPWVVLQEKRLGIVF